MPPLALRAVVLGLLLLSSARAQADELPPEVLSLVLPAAGPDPRTDDRRSAASIELLLALGRQDEARREAGQFIKVHAVARPTLTARVILSVGEAMAAGSEWARVRSWMRDQMGLIDRSAPVAEKARAHALLGHALLETGSVADADREYEQVRQLAGPLAASFDEPVLDDRVELGMRGRALNAVGEARFREAERAREALDVGAMPTYRGGASAQEIRRFVADELGAWVKRRRKAIVEVEKAYLQVVDIVPVAPPRWVLASGAQMGRVWDELARAPRQARLAPVIARDSGLRAVFLAAVDALTAPDRGRAKAAHEMCLRFSVKYQYTTDASRSCEAWLRRSYPHEYTSNELVGVSPDHAPLGVPDRAAPLGRDGKPVATPRPREPPAVLQGRPEERRRPPSSRP